MAEAESLGLGSLGESQVERIGPDLMGVTTLAGVPIDQRTAPIFYLQRTLVVSSRADMPDEVLGRTDFSVRYAGDHVTIEYADRFSSAFDAFTGRDTGLAGTEIRRTAEFDSPALEAYVSAWLQAGLAGSGSDSLSPESLASVPIQADNYVETVTIVRPDGSERRYPSGQVDLSAVLSELGGSKANVKSGCVKNCFAFAGIGIGAATGVCLGLGLGGCTAACVVTGGIACLPCVGAVLAVCGVGGGIAALGSLVGCLAFCVNPSFTPPPPTPTPIPCTGDCNGDRMVSVDELVRSVSVVLGILSVDECRALDADGNGVVSIGELIAAVRKALGGCGA